MCEPVSASNATLAAQALYAKLQKLSEDIQLQHSILTAQKETVLKSRQKTYDGIQRTEPANDQRHLVHTHAGTVLQHRAMIIKHYEVIQQHKQMVKEQGLHVQNLTTTLLNIQQETNVVDELMNTKMAENRTMDGAPRTNRKKFRSNSDPNIHIESTLNPENNTKISPDITVTPITTSQTNTNSNTDDNNTESDNSQQFTIITTTSTTTTTPTSTTTETTTISSTSTSISTTTTSTTTTTTTKTSPCTSPVPFDETPLPLSP
eukprot:Phypoly_transcript_13935.p1 GENE.Phypoly_transcript_13935~~Phypoly_transcript_13935.p1  ORF type:complete len:262 (+),score=54.04 Phypoly_transcript_13935:146-931(+)